MSPEEAQRLLAASPPVAWAQASRSEAQAMVDALLAAGVPAALGHDPSCGGGCRPGFQVLVREEDRARAAALHHERWLESVQREGVAPLPLPEAAPGGELPCPACGTAAPLVAGACSDCGLQLE